MKSVHLVLGSGGARGMAHIGVIDQLLEDGYTIASVTGCSMGAVVGGIYAAGYLDAYREWLLTLNKTNVFNLFDFTFTTQGFVKGDKVFQKIQQITGHHEIEDLAIPFTAVAADLLHKKEVHFTKGNLFKALRASIAIPGVFTPVVEEHSVLVDGSVLNPLPINLVQKKEGELVFAVNLNGPYLPAPAKKEKPIAKESNDVWKWLNKLPLPSWNNTLSQPKQTKFSLFDLVNTSYDFTQDRLVEMMIDVYRPDLVVEIPRNACGVFEFYRAKELIDLGRAQYLKAAKHG